MNLEPSSEPETGYERFFGFHQTPFSLAPDTRFRFQSVSHAAALAQVTYALQRREPVIVVTGEIGTGKTLLCRTVIERLQRQTFLSIINDPLLGQDDLLKQMLQDFGVISKDRSRLGAATRHDLIHALQQFLSSLTSLHAHAVVIIDEAQHLQPDVLEHVRLVSSIQDDRGTMLQIILVGQTDLDQTLSRPELRAVRQRMSRTVRLEALSEAEVAQYIGHRLTVARTRPTQQTQSNFPGARELERVLAEWDALNGAATFTPEAVQAVARVSRGIPRVVNLVCDRALEAAYSRKLRTVEASSITMAAQALCLPPMPEDGLPSLGSSASVASPPLVSTAVSVFGASAADSARPRRYLTVAASFLVIGATIGLGGRAISRMGQGEPPSPAAEAIPSAAPPKPAPSLASPASDAVSEAVSAAAAEPTLSPTPEATRTTPPPDASTGEAFEIVVASFHTAARATDVAAAVAALGHPVRQRTAGSWQQVLVGPYASAAECHDAQERLERAGFTGTQRVAAARD